MPNQPSIFSSRGLVFVLVALLAILIVAVLISAAKIIKGVPEGQKVDTAKENRPSLQENLGLSDTSIGRSDISGLLIFSGESKATPASFKTYSLRFGADSSSVVNESDFFKIPSSSFVEFENVVNPENFYFKAFANGAAEGEEAKVLNTLFHADVPNTVEQITAAPGQEFGTVSWSQTSGLLAYMSFRDGVSIDSESANKIESWEIIVTNKENEVQFKRDGAVHPAWTPDGTKLVYLKSDGLYIYDLKNGKEEKALTIVTDSGAKLSPGTMFDISYDGNYLVLSMRGRGHIEVYHVIWDRNSLALVGRLVNEGVNYSWPVISPDGKTYAIIAKDIDGETLMNSRIEVRSVGGRNILLSHPLNEFNPGSVFLDDWIAKTVEF